MREYRPHRSRVAAGRGATDMDEGWVCGSCRSINRPGANRCYSCRQNRAVTENVSAPPVPSAGASRAFPTRADVVLQRDVWFQLMSLEGMREARGAARPCGQVRLAGTEVLDQDGSAERSEDIPAGLPGGPGTWRERWTLDRCGEVVSYVVTFAPDPTGGTNFSVRFPPDTTSASRGETVDEIPPAIVVLPSVPDAVAMLESFNDINLPGITDLPGITTLQLTPDKWAAAAGLPVARIDALAEVSVPIWQLIRLASAAGAAADVQELQALLERRTTAVRFSELGRAVDRIAASMSPSELGRLASEGEMILGRFATEGSVIPVPPDADPSRTAIGNGVENLVEKLYAGKGAQGEGSPMVAYVACYRSIANAFGRTFDPEGTAEQLGLPKKANRRWPFGR